MLSFGIHCIEKMMVFSLFFLSVLFSFMSQAVEVKSYRLVHGYWKDFVVSKDSKFCRSNNDCGEIEHLSEDKIKIKWEKYAPEIFVRQKMGNIWLADAFFSSSWKEEYEQFVYTFDEPFVKVNPYGRTPLSALVKFPTEENVKISIRIKGKDGAPDIVKEFDGYRKEHEFPLLGLYPNYDNQVFLTATNKKGIEKTNKLIVPVGDSGVQDQWFPTQKKDEQFNYYATYEGNVFDEYGNVRYAFNGECGWCLFYFCKDGVFKEERGGITKYSLLGEVLQSYPYPSGFYGYMHGMGFKNNGNLLVFGTYNNTKAIFDGKEDESHRDFVLELDAKTGAVVAQYDLAEMVNPDRSLIVKSAEKDSGKIDWAHTNGIDYDAKNKAVIVSGRHLGILKIDEKRKKPLWWLTPHQLTHKSGRNGDKGDVSHLLLTVVDKNGKPYSQDVQKGIKKADGFKWPLKTHNVKYVGKGVYSIFDNSGSMYDKNLYTTKNSVASVFKIDDKKKTVRQVFLKELKEYSDMGSIVIFNHKTKDYWVFASNVSSSNTVEIKNGIFHRFDQNGNELYKAVIHRRNNGWIYAIQPYEFYSDNNWPTPKE